MKQIKFIFKNVLFPASFFFTIFNIFAYLVEFGDTGDKTKLVNFSLILGVFIIIALGNNIFKTELSMFAKIVIHYLSFLIPLILFVVILGNNGAIAGVFTVVTVVYAIIAAPILIIRKALHKKENDEQKYDSQFK
ncbi:MAG: hypothetical protein IKU19_00120 [Clostridia bacterium]|nr:hypothetical protein [Clostridia bacterium]